MEHGGPRDSGVIALAVETLHSLGSLCLRATGSSMLPALRPGDVLRFEPCAAEEAQIDDVLLFRRDNRLVIHRVLSRTTSTLLTQGDSLARPDPPVDNVNVLGRMVGLSRRGRSLPHRQSLHAGDRLARWLFRRFDLTTSLFLRWQRLSIRSAA